MKTELQPGELFCTLYKSHRRGWVVEVRDWRNGIVSQSTYRTREEAEHYHPGLRDKKRHVTADDLRPRLLNDGLVVVTLAVGESSWNPVCPSCRIMGPAVIEYRRHADGGVDAVMLQGEDGHAR
jgi:hypothetical protein